MVSYANEKEQTTSGRPVSEGCAGIPHDQAKTQEEIEIPEEIMVEALSELSFHDSESSPELDREIIRSLFGIFRRVY